MPRAQMRRFRPTSLRPANPYRFNRRHHLCHQSHRRFRLREQNHHPHQFLCLRSKHLPQLLCRLHSALGRQPGGGARWNCLGRRGMTQRWNFLPSPASLPPTHLHHCRQRRRLRPRHDPHFRRVHRANRCRRRRALHLHYPPLNCLASTPHQHLRQSAGFPHHGGKFFAGNAIGIPMIFPINTVSNVILNKTAIRHITKTCNSSLLEQCECHDE